MIEETIRKVISMIFEEYIETAIVGTDEYENDFPYTLACSKFIVELKSKNTTVNFNEVFKDEIKDKIFDEIIKYLER